MRHSSFVSIVLGVCTLASLLPVAATAQTSYEPKLVFTIHGGAVTGHGLWRVAKQPICLLQQTNIQCSSNYDTLALARTVGSSITGGLSATLFPSPNLGFQLDVTYLGLGLEDGCAGLFYHPDPPPPPDSVDMQRNKQVCDNIQASTVAASALGVHAGVVLRAAPGGTVSPYVRGGVGLTFLSRSTIAMQGEFSFNNQLFSRAVIADDQPDATAISYLVGVGITSPIGPGYQLRVEVADIVASQARATGPADIFGQAPSVQKMYHHIAVTLGLDIVLEKKRGRRY